MRTCFFAGFVVATLVPVFHGIVVWGWKAQDYRVSLYYLLGVIAFNATGAIAYATKFPERFWRRTFDLFGGSHQIMHVMVLCAAIVHLFGLVRDFDHLHGAPLACKR
jgi:adiponectin receptor